MTVGGAVGGGGGTGIETTPLQRQGLFSGALLVESRSGLRNCRPRCSRHRRSDCRAAHHSRRKSKPRCCPKSGNGCFQLNFRRSQRCFSAMFSCFFLSCAGKSHRAALRGFGGELYQRCSANVKGERKTPQAGGVLVRGLLFFFSPSNCFTDTLLGVIPGHVARLHGGDSGRQSGSASKERDAFHAFFAGISTPPRTARHDA